MYACIKVFLFPYDSVTTFYPHCPVVGVGHGVAEITGLGGPSRKKLRNQRDLEDGGGRLKSRDGGLGDWEKQAPCTKAKSVF